MPDSQDFSDPYSSDDEYALSDPLERIVLSGTSAGFTNNLGRTLTVDLTAAEFS